MSSMSVRRPAPNRSLPVRVVATSRTVERRDDRGRSEKVPIEPNEPRQAALWRRSPAVLRLIVRDQFAVRHGTRRRWACRSCTSSYRRTIACITSRSSSRNVPWCSASSDIQPTPGRPFREVVTGLDHLEFMAHSREDLYGSALTFRDPDNIQLEFFWRSPWRFDG